MSLIQAEAMEDCQSREIEDGEEHRCNHICEHTNDHSRDKWLLNRLCKCLIDNCNCQEYREHSDQSFSEEGEDGSGDSDSSESSCVSCHDPERFLRAEAETAVVKSDLDVGVLVHEFNAAVEAFQVASNTAFQNVPNDITSWVGLFILIDEILKSDSDHSYDSNKESTPCERS